MTIEQGPTVDNGSAGGSEPNQVWEPTTFADKMVFQREVARAFLKGEISWDEQWYYEQTYGFGVSRDKKI